ncbi:hypothetical protein [Haloechinothrix sp. LS1_15]|uniref:hypothetical protein n=1 Tax=Haloechinothrix sp. LS1_15 TaxID=2652248 RepID=UPI0029488EDF|nr:hypothetical protein [Haloechinothrix sp. LS1_15]MDV6011009.1 hypothetical protein [Haloechinothrix sp. LS1_15]
MSGDGYSYESDALRMTASRLRSGVLTLDQAIERDVQAADAGISSEFVAEAMSRTHHAAAAMAQYLEETAEKVDETTGAYDEIENTHAGRLELEQQRMDEE